MAKKVTVEEESTQQEPKPDVPVETQDPPRREVTQDPPRREVAEREEERPGFSVPRDMVLIPSLGKLYPPSHPLHNQENIEVRHLTAADEDILTSRALLRSGKALDHLLQSCIMDKSISVGDLISGDKNSIMTFLRISGYGPEYDVKIDCPSCEEEVQHTFDLSQLSVRTLDLTPEDQNNPVFTLELPSGVVVDFKFLNSAEEAEIAEILETTKRKTNSPLERNITTKYSRQILAVNGDTNQATISSFIKSMSVRDSRAFRKFLIDNEPDVIMKQDFICPMCSHKEEVDIPIGVGFFWPE